MSSVWMLQTSSRWRKAPSGYDGLVFLLTSAVSRVGRSHSVAVCLPHDTVSRIHAELVVSCNNLVVRDLDSRNGTYLNGRRVATGIVKAGSEIRFGDIRLAVTRSSASDEFSTKRTIARELEVNAKDDSSATALTAAQSRVIPLLALGLSEKEIANSLSVSPRTVHNHIQAIYQRWGVSSRAQLMAKLLTRNRHP